MTETFPARWQLQLRETMSRRWEWRILLLDGSEPLPYGPHYCQDEEGEPDILMCPQSGWEGGWDVASFPERSSTVESYRSLRTREKAIKDARKNARNVLQAYREREQYVRWKNGEWENADLNG